MKKKMILTGLFGALVGVALSTLITLAISLMHNNGYYYAVVPELIAFCGSEVSAMLLQKMCIRDRFRMSKTNTKKDG